MLKRSVRALLLALIAIIVVATPVLAYVYRASYAVSNNSTTAYDMIGVIGDVNNAWMAANGFMNASANDTRIETLAGVARPHMVVDDKTLTAIPSPAFSQTNLYYTTGNSELLSFDIIPGYDGYIAAADNATLELSDNFTYQTTGWIDTDNGTDKYLVEKSLAFRTFVSPTVSGNVTAEILSAANATEVLRPDGHIQCLLPDEAGAACNDHWQNVDEVVASDAEWNGIGLAAVDKTDIYSLEDSANITASDRVDSITVTIRGEEDTNGYFWVGLELGGDTTWGTQRTPGLGFTTYNEVLARPGGGAWQLSDLADLRIMVRCKCDGGGDLSHVSWCYVTVNFSYPVVDVAVTATGVSSGEHSCNVTAAPLIWSPGDVLTFDGSATSNINCGNLYSDIGKLWVSFWIKPGVTFDSGAATDQFIWAKNVDGTHFVRCYLEADDGKLMVYRYKGVLLYQFAAKNGGADITSWTGGIWYHVITSFSDTAGVRFIVNNGTVVTNASDNNTPNGGEFVIGDYADGGGFGFVGDIANVTTGTDNLTAAEELLLYENIAPGDEDNLWYIGEGTGTSIESYGSSDNTGTADSNTVWSRDTRPCKFAIIIDGTAEGGYAPPVDVPDTSGNWTFMAGNSMPYADNITISVNATQQLWYAPTSYIVGTTLPDRQGADNDGTFHWGANPTGVTVTLGSTVSSGQPSLGADIDQPTQDILPDVEVSDWFVDPDIGIGGALLTNPIRPFVTLLSDNSTLTERQVWILYGLAFVLFVTVATSAVVRGHHGITGIMCAASMIGLVALTVWPLWTVVFIVGAVVVGLVSERSPSL